MPRATNSWGLASAVFLAILASSAGAQITPASNKPAAVVNGEAITLADVEGVVKLGPQVTPPPTPAQRQQMQAEALTLLIDDVLMQQFLRRQCPPVDAKEVAKRLDDMK